MLQLGLGADLSHLKSSIWDQRSAGGAGFGGAGVSELGMEAVFVVSLRGSFGGGVAEGMRWVCQSVGTYFHMGWVPRGERESNAHVCVR